MLTETAKFEDGFYDVNLSYVNNKENYKTSWTVDLVYLLWTFSKKYLLEGVAFEARLISSVSSFDQCKSSLEIRK